ncbi:MAG: hypothetical protein M9955_24730 [Rhizobiaceae bacterium]|nr:hypothetical protein [Rhizobiaceae bacterium]
MPANIAKAVLPQHIGEIFVGERAFQSAEARHLLHPEALLLRVAGNPVRIAKDAKHAAGFQDAERLIQRLVLVDDVMETLEENHGVRRLVGDEISLFERAAVIAHVFRELRHATKREKVGNALPRRLEHDFGRFQADHIVPQPGKDFGRPTGAGPDLHDGSLRRETHRPDAVEDLEHIVEEVRMAGIPVQRLLPEAELLVFGERARIRIRSRLQLLETVGRISLESRMHITPEDSRRSSRVPPRSQTDPGEWVARARQCCK